MYVDIVVEIFLQKHMCKCCYTYKQIVILFILSRHVATEYKSFVPLTVVCNT